MTVRRRLPSVTRPVRWLDADEQRVWRSFLHAQRLLFDRLDRELTAAENFGHSYYEVLVMLSESPGRVLRMSELADLTQSSRSRLSHAVARLEQLGWVRREACPSDRRGFNAVLTDEGFAALKHAAPLHVEGVRTHLFDQLEPDEIEMLGRISAKLVAHLAGGAHRSDCEDS